MADSETEDFANLVPQRIVVDAAEWEFLQALVADDVESGAYAAELVQQYRDDAAGSMEPTEVRISAYGIGEHLTVLVPQAWEPRIRALEPVAQFGPQYSRRVTDTLVDITHQVRSGHLDLAERSLAYCERVAGN